jgi:hypothetical protein
LRTQFIGIKFFFISGATIAEREITVTAKPETDSEKDACLNMPDLNAGLPVAPEKGYIKPFDFYHFYLIYTFKKSIERF